jgi:hypothetical protein
VASPNADGYTTWTNKMLADVNILHVKRNEVVGDCYLEIKDMKGWKFFASVYVPIPASSEDSKKAYKKQSIGGAS